MLVIARQIGMPAEFVALRHEATHDEMPGLKRLVDATTEALGWLWRVYWSRLEEVDSEGKSMRDFAGSRVELETLLKGFRRDRRDALRGGKDEVEQVEAVRRAVDDCVNMCDTDETHVETFATVLVEDRLLLPASRE
jgi:ribosomal biogenesis protein LAS1